MSSLCVGLAETINKVGPAFLENRQYFPRQRVLAITNV